LTYRIALAACLCLGVQLVSSIPSAKASAAPIVAVFEVQAKSVPSIKQETLEAMTDFLNARLAASARFRTVPRAQIKQRLNRLKVESYKECYDQACQIELGRELAANKSLSTKVVRAEQRCVLTLELYDLKSATTDAAHSELVECGEGPLFAALSRGVRALLEKGRTRESGGTATSRPADERPKVSLYVKSDPRGADVLLDGLHRGQTPVRLSVERSKRYKLVLIHEDYQTEKRSVQARDAMELHVPMRLTAEGRRELATTSEWVGIGFGPGYLAGSDSAALVVSMRMGNIKWYRFFWTLLDFNGVLDVSSDQGSGEGGGIGAMIIGTRPGFPLYLGSRGQHQLLFGVGINFTALLESEPSNSSTTTTTTTTGDSPSFFSLSPGVDYVYNLLDGALPLGIGVRANLPVAGEVGDGPYPYALMASVNIGFSLYRFGKGLQRAQRAAREKGETE
jgi:hypothetical protein